MLSMLSAWIVRMAEIPFPSLSLFVESLRSEV